MGFMSDDAYKFPSAMIKGALANALFVEMWYFEMFDAVADVELSMTFSINNPRDVALGKVFGLKKSCDILSGVVFSNSRRKTSIDNYIDYYEARDDELYVNFGNFAFIEAVSESSIHLHGSDPYIDVEYDLVYHQLLPHLPPQKTRISKGRNDHFWFYPRMPAALVEGSITFGGETRKIHGKGYHDHDWGSPTKLAWSPFIVIPMNDCCIITYVSQGKYGNVYLLTDGKWKELPMPSLDIIETTRLEYIGKRNEIVHYDCPSKMRITSETDRYKVDFVVKSNDRFITYDLGLEKGKKKVMHATGMISANYIANGEIYIDGSVMKVFSDVGATFQYYDEFDYIKFLFL